VDVGTKLLNQTSNRINFIVENCVAQRFRAAHKDTSLGPTPQLGDIAPDTRLDDHRFSHGCSMSRSRGSTVAAAAAAAAGAAAAAAVAAVGAAGASGCGRVSDSGAGWVRLMELSQHGIEVIIGFIAHHFALLALALALISIVDSSLLVLLRHSEQCEQGR
jgi:hypothetical protein